MSVIGKILSILCCLYSVVVCKSTISFCGVVLYWWAPSSMAVGVCIAYVAFIVSTTLAITTDHGVYVVGERLHPQPVKRVLVIQVSGHVAHC